MTMSYTFEMQNGMMKITADWGIICEVEVNVTNIDDVLFNNVPLDIADRAMVRDEMIYGTGYMHICRTF